MKRSHLQRAFTLIELLVVIAIIAILAALTALYAGKLIKTSQRITCSSNLRQVGAAIYLYSGETNGLLPYSLGGSVGPQKVDNVNTSGNISYMAQLLEPYIEDEVWDCPDPLNRANRKQPDGFGQVWTKPAWTQPLNPGPYDAPLSSDWQPEFRRGHRLLEYAQPILIPILYCAYCNATGSGTPGHRPWPHAGTVNQLYLDGHVGTFKPTWPD